jgi:dienelactone hydrolase
MSPIDIVLLGAVLLVAGGWLLAPDRVRRLGLWAPLGLIALTAAQIAVQGFEWQILPSFLVVLAAAGLAVAPRRTARARGWIRALGCIALILLALAALGPWTLAPPTPRLTQPSGPYAVGTEIYRWVDASRAETSAPDPAARRNVIVQAWYPAAPGATGRQAPYIDGLRHLPNSVAGLPRFLMRHYDRIDTYGVLDAPLAANRPRWPVVMLLAGYGAPRAFYTSIATGLASRGYVVLAVDHPYEAAVTELADGHIATTVERFTADDPDRTRFMEGRLQVRIADVKFLLDQLARPGALRPPLDGHLDLEHVAAIGQSLGGAAAAASMAEDPRIKAAANVDGTLYGGIAGGPADRPFLLLESDHAETRHSERYEAGNRRFFERFGGGYRYEIKRANHFSFTDALLFLAPPGRWAASLAIGGSRDPGETHRATVDILAAFLQAPLLGPPASVEAAAARYRGIVGGRVNPPRQPAA